MGIIGRRLYVAEFGNPPQISPRVVSLPVSGGSQQTVLSGFDASIIALGTHRGWVYVADQRGRAYRIRP